MANLFGNDIGLNYKGLISLGSSVNQNISGTLQYLTDGDGNNLPLQVATGLVGVVGGTIAYTTGTNSKDVLTQTYTINNTGGTNTITGIKINATETAIVGTTHSLLDLQVGGVTQFRVDNTGLVNKGTFNYGVYAGNYFGFYNGATVLFAVDSVKTLNGYGEFRNFGNAYIGSNSFSPQARLHLRGDGVSNIFRVDNNLGSQLVAISSTGSIDSNSGVLNLNPSSSGIYFSTVAIIASVAGSGLFLRYGAHTGMTNGITLTSNSDLPLTITSGTGRAVGIIGTFAAAAGSANYRPLSIAYTINNTGAQTGNTTGILLNATATNLNGMGHTLLDLQVNGVSRFSVGSDGMISNIIGWFDNSGYTSRLYQNVLQLYNGNTLIGFMGGGGHGMNGKLFVGSTVVTPVARFTVRGDGTNPIARFETSAGVAAYVINAAGNTHTFTGGVDISDNVAVAATKGYYFTNRGGIIAPGDGIFQLRNNAASDFSRLQFGGSTNAFPSLKRNTTALQARLADDTDFTFIQGKLRTETNFTSEPAVMASGYIVLYDLDGTAYKVLATAL